MPAAKKPICHSECVRHELDDDPHQLVYCNMGKKCPTYRNGCAHIDCIQELAEQGLENQISGHDIRRIRAGPGTALASQKKDWGCSHCGYGANRFIYVPNASGTGLRAKKY